MQLAFDHLTGSKMLFFQNVPTLQALLVER